MLWSPLIALMASPAREKDYGMTVLIVAIVIALVIIGLSVWANARFSDQARLPMQWSLSGAVNWTAPRVLALSFTPALMIGILSVIVYAAMTGRLSPVHQDRLIRDLVLLGVISVGCHLFHLWMIGRALRRNGG